MTFDDVTEWERPREARIECEIGYYYGPDNCKWQDYLTEISDFDAVFGGTTPHNMMMETLLLQGKESDVSLVSSNNIRFDVHRSILRISPYFDAFLMHAPKDTKIIAIDSETNNLQCFVYFLYTGRINEELVTNWKELFKLAMYYIVPNIERPCELQIMKNVNKNMQDIKEHMKFSLTFHAKKLRKYLVRLGRSIQEESS